MTLRYTEGFDVYKPGLAVERFDAAEWQTLLSPANIPPLPKPDTIRVTAGPCGAYLEIPLREGVTTFVVRKDGERWLIDHAQEEPKL